MKFKLNHLVLTVICLSFCAGNALADTFDFSFVFNNASFGIGEVHGSLTGTQSVFYVMDPSFTSLVINGHDITGLVDLGGVNPSTRLMDPAFERISFDKNLNNFMVLGDNGRFSSILGSFYNQGAVDSFTEALYFPDNLDLRDVPLGSSGTWTLTNVSNSNASVPDASATIGLAGLGFLVLAALRRKFSRA